jgi:hypothetical protein
MVVKTLPIPSTTKPTRSNQLGSNKQLLHSQSGLWLNLFLYFSFNYPFDSFIATT